jgi:hypothetical protein
MKGRQVNDGLERIWKEAVVHYPGIRVEELSKTTKDLKHSRSPGQVFNPGPPECEAEVLTTRPRCSILIYMFLCVTCIRSMYIQTCILTGSAYKVYLHVQLGHVGYRTYKATAYASVLISRRWQCSVVTYGNHLIRLS